MIDYKRLLTKGQPLLDKYKPFIRDCANLMVETSICFVFFMLFFGIIGFILHMCHPFIMDHIAKGFWIFSDQKAATPVNLTPPQEVLLSELIKAGTVQQGTNIVSMVMDYYSDIITILVTMFAVLSVWCAIYQHRVAQKLIDDSVEKHLPKELATLRLTLSRQIEDEISVAVDESEEIEFIRENLEVIEQLQAYVQSLSTQLDNLRSEVETLKGTPPTAAPVKDDSVGQEKVNPRKPAKAPAKGKK